MSFLNKTGVIVLTYNSAQVIKACLQSILNQDVDISLIVIDNASTDNTLEIVKKFEGIEIIESEKNLGFSWGINTVARIFHERGYENVVCINPDSVIDPSCIAELLKTKEQSGAGLVQASVYLPDRTHVNSLGNVIHYTGISYCPEFGSDLECTRDVEVAAVSGACMLIDLESWHILGGLKEDYFMYMEDTDFSWRMRLIGKKVLLSSRARCFHDYALRLPPWKLSFLDLNRVKMIFTNYALKTLFLLFPMLLVLEIGLLLWSIPKRYFFRKIKGYMVFCTELSLLLRQRKDIQKLRIISDRKVMDMMELELHVPGLFIPCQSCVNRVLKWYGKMLLFFLK